VTQGPAALLKKRKKEKKDILSNKTQQKNPKRKEKTKNKLKIKLKSIILTPKETANSQIFLKSKHFQ
jgi:hypothetical protein